MRQAGRYLPEYQATRKIAGSFFDLCFNPQLASEVTIQPITRFNFDAAIIFSDILTIPKALGLDVRFVEKLGPQITGKKIEFNSNKFSNHLLPIYEAIKITRSRLVKTKPLIGFTGAPFTLLCYILAGGKVENNFENIKQELYREANNPIMLSVLEEAISEHAINQIKAGANIIKLFDSWAGLAVGSELFDKLVILPTQRIISRLKSSFPNIPIMSFPRNASYEYIKYVNKVAPDILTIDYNVNLSWARDVLAKKVILQGNLDPKLLLGSKSEIAKQVAAIVNILGAGKFIFNLGHGILPNTPIENVEYLIKCLRYEG